MTLENVIEGYAKAHNVTKVQARKEILKVTDFLRSAVLDKGALVVPHFGRFKVRHQGARRVHTPNGKMDLSPMWRVGFTPFKEMRSPKIPAVPVVEG